MLTRVPQCMVIVVVIEINLMRRLVVPHTLQDNIHQHVAVLPVIEVQAEQQVLNLLLRIVHSLRA